MAGPLSPRSQASTPTSASLRLSPASPRGGDVVPAMRRSPTASLGMYFSPSPQKTVSVLHRPYRPYMASKNVENLEAQFQKDLLNQERHAAASRRLQAERWHHNGPSVPSLLEQGHIVDRGRAKTVTQAAHGVFDPILSEFKIPPSAVPKDKRPSSAPPSRPTMSTPRGDKVVQALRGERNPITGEVKTGFEPSPTYEERNRKEFERNHGGRGIAFRPCRDVSFNPITGEVQSHASPAAAKAVQPRPMSAPRSAYHTTPQALGDRPATPSKRQIQHGPSWGQYNPVNHQWQVPPQHSKFQDPSAQVERTAGVTGASLRKVALPANQGVYNPILNHWTVPPSNPRVAAGLAFAPTTMFTRPTPATIRTPR